jgi:hypothetical protein
VKVNIQVETAEALDHRDATGATIASVDTSNPAKDGQRKTGQSKRRSSGVSCSASVGREQVAISGIPR